MSFALVLNTGAGRDPVSMPGLASFTTAMIQEGTANRTSSQIADEMEFMGSQLAAATGRESTTLAAETLTRHFPKALEIAADLVQNAAFPEDELERIRNERLTSLRRMRDDPTAMAGRHAPGLILGIESAYGHPLSGTEESVQAVSRGDMADYYSRGYGPEGSTLVVVGDVSLDEVTELAEQWLGAWQAPDGGGAAPAAPEDHATPEPTTLYLLDKPGAAQSVIRIGLTSVPRLHPDYPALALLNHLFGGQFIARLNMNLREDKGYSYGYRSWFEWHRGLSLFMTGGSVQTAVSREAVVENLRELSDLVGDRPVTEAELEAARAAMLRQFPSSFENSWQVLEQLVHLVSFNLPDDYYRTLPDALEAVTLEDVRRAAAELVDNSRLTLLVVGDREAIEPGLREVGVPVRLLDQEGREVQE